MGHLLPRRAWRTWLTGLAMLWLLLAGSAQAAAPSCDAVHAVTEATRLSQAQGQGPQQALVGVPDAQAPRWQPGSRLSYRLELGDCPGAPGARAVLVPRVGGPYRLSVEGGAGHDLLTPGAPLQALRNGRVGLLVQLDPGVRALEIHLEGPRNVAGGLIGTQAGPQAAVLAGPAAGPMRWQQFTEGASVVIALAGGLVLLVWAMRRNERHLLWFGMSCLVWALRGQLLTLDVIPVPAAWYEPLNPLMIGWAALALAASTRAVVGQQDARSGRWLGAAALALLAGYLLAALWWRAALPYRLAGMGFGFAVLAWTIVLFVRGRTGLDPARARWLAAGFCGVVAGGVHDSLLILGVLRPTWWTLLTPGFAVMLLCHLIAAGMLLLRTLRRAEQANVELEQAIAAKASQLEASYALLRDAERERAQAQAREHLLREMHDGIGAQLMTTLRGLERAALSPDQVRDALQDGLDELRLLMDSGDIGRTLGGALAAWRNRWDPRLDALGLHLHWEVDPDLQPLGLSPEAVLQVMRILQEAVTNVVKHAQGQRVHVRVSHAPAQRQLLLAVSDDGVGLPADRPAGDRGRGLANMQTRAQVLGGRLTVQRRPTGGSEVRLLVPVAAAETVRT